MTTATMPVYPTAGVTMPYHDEATIRSWHVRLPPTITEDEFVDLTLRAQSAGLLDWTNPLTMFQIRYRWNAAGFVRDVLGADPDPWQEEILDAASDGHRHIACRSGHGPGKTTVISWVNVWFLVCFTPCKLVVTAVAAGTIEDGLGNEIKLWVARLPPDIKSLFNVTGDRVALISAPNDNFLSMRTSRPENPQSIAGIHAPHVCLTVDEASALPDASFDAVGSSMSAPHAIMFLIGNPTRNEGYFFDCFNKLRDEWYCVHISSLDSKRVDPGYIRMVEKRYGRESNEWRYRILGEFPLGNDDAIIPKYLIEEAVGRDVQPLQGALDIWGLDVARSLQRDKSVLVKRASNALRAVAEHRVTPDGLHTPLMLRWQFNDTTRLVGVVKQEWDNTPESQRPSVICVDGIGFGASVADSLRALGIPAIAVNVSEKKARSERFVNLKGELWFDAREWFQSQAVRLDVSDGQLIEELSVVEYYPAQDGRIMVEDKDAVRKRKRYSPDGADAVILTFASTVAFAETGQRRDVARGGGSGRDLGLV